ncbi:hypothetical protein RchiOBHm_Chr2g0161641 [Rosa chinensis]|uniref:Uncharacterized protein n=1 Tax=Rosa chinensis TaxID=74649 RepID=A0A2P6S2T5_ROSCH|nr:hypothetical protein RchiOBHm_Chr2g0161641 [Rosa chinensis]
MLVFCFECKYLVGFYYLDTYKQTVDTGFQAQCFSFRNRYGVQDFHPTSQLYFGRR